MCIGEHNWLAKREASVRQSSKDVFFFAGFLFSVAKRKSEIGFKRPGCVVKLSAAAAAAVLLTFTTARVIVLYCVTNYYHTCLFVCMAFSLDVFA